MGNSDTETSKLNKVLALASDVLFPAKPGTKVQVDSTGPCGDTPLHAMTRREDTEAVKLLIEAGANVNAVGEMGETPLHVAVRKGHVEIIEALLNAGASTSVRSKFDRTPAELAEERGGNVVSTVKRSRRVRRQMRP
jgi:ankyrin repeat protein